MVNNRALSDHAVHSLQAATASVIAERAGYQSGNVNFVDSNTKTKIEVFVGTLSPVCRLMPTMMSSFLHYSWYTFNLIDDTDYISYFPIEAQLNIHADEHLTMGFHRLLPNSFVSRANSNIINPTKLL